ncbi:IS4 family transposase, partial [Candidatus Sumerlaeota bacterium]
SLRSLKRRPTAVDGTLIRALPSMVWALWLDDEHRAAKLHLQFDLLKGAPEKPALTHAQAAETNALRQRLEPGRLYVTDRGYFDYSLMAAILTAHSSFVARARNNLVYDVIEERPLSDAARQRGVEADHIVRVGCPKNRDQLERPLRLVRLRVQSQGPPRGAGRVDHKSKLYRTRDTEHLLTLLTDQLDLDVELIALLYRQRWQIELFFRWFKTILQADKLLSRSKNGLTIIIYCALIASQLVVLWTGRKPTKRTYEMLCFYFSGWASDDDLAAHLERLETSAPSH